MGLYSDPTFSDPTTASFDYDTMGNMTYDGENSLHYSYNYLNLPNKVTRQDTTSSAATELILVKYKYLWDGTKVRAVNAEGVGYEYMGSLRFTIDGDAVEVESIPFSGGRILRTSAGYEPKYYVTDHLGSTRAIVNQDGKTVEAIFDYMPYGTEHTYASSPTAGADYRFTGKERQDFFNMEDIYDSQARFQSISGRFMTIDPLAEKYYPISPYAYCAGNPVRYIDPDGRQVHPAGEGELKMILNTLRKQDQKHIQLDDNGYINKKKMAKHKSNSYNYNALMTLVASDLDINVKLSTEYEYRDENGDNQEAEMGYGDIIPEFADPEGNDMNGLSTGETGLSGVSLMPGEGKSGVNSPDGSIHVIINSKLSSAGRAETYSHEANGHVLLYEKTRSREKAAHNYQGLSETNIVLKQMIIRSKRETIKNMQGE